MPIDRLSPTAAVIAALRAELARKPDQQRGATRKRPAVDDLRQPGEPDPTVLRRELKDLCGDVDPGDAAAMRELRPRLVKAVLLWEFGQRLREHPEWQGMLDGVTATLERDPEQQARFARLVAELRRSAG